MTIGFDKFGSLTQISNKVQSAGEKLARGIKNEAVEPISGLPWLDEQGVTTPQAFQQTATKYAQNTTDKRVRISAKAVVSERERLYGDPGDQGHLLNPLHETDGILFPYTPVISASLQADYSNLATMHSIQDFYTYAKTPAPQFTISGAFTAQNKKEARYCLAVIHFLRSVTKMNFGRDDPLAGLLPPVLRLNGYGTFMFNNLPVVITTYNIELPDAVDYVETVVANESLIRKREELAAAADLGYDPRPKQPLQYAQEGNAWIPARFQLSVNCIVQHTPQRLRNFDLADFRKGKLLKQGLARTKGMDPGGWW